MLGQAPGMCHAANYTSLRAGPCLVHHCHRCPACPQLWDPWNQESQRGPAREPATQPATPAACSPAPCSQMAGMFWNYFSVGMDAKAAYGFHSLREKRPWAASGRAMNQAWYGYYSLASGWFCAAPPLRNKATLQVWGCPAGGSPCLGGKRALGQCIWSLSLSKEHKLQMCPLS